ncbi:MAG: class I SAM-dependent methyltransferase, partial [Sphaerochaetaceae bacterium]|nr:class I SAM-dependent methyltransferase [Sphaerochaetaceae bacterium]
MPTFSKQDYALLEKGLDLLEITLNAEQTAQFSAYMAEIALFNRKYRLVGAEGADFVVKHLLDSLAPVSYFNTLLTARPEPLRICDVGSGAGLPGIPLAIVLNKNPFTLIERSGRRAGFLRNAVAMCNLSERVEIIEKDLSDVL